jgi:thiol-disulfide isomerase/thioredoxin
MKRDLFNQTQSKFFGRLFLTALVFIQLFSVGAIFAQVKKRVPVKKQTAKSKIKHLLNTDAATDMLVPKTTPVDAVALKNLVRREGENAKPLLINFWATWCPPCRAEFPELVKINADYKGKIDFIIISLDELSEINGDVPKFLREMKAEMPSYLLKTSNNEAAIASVAGTYRGGLPMTVLYDAKGAVAYSIMNKIKPQILRAEIEKVIIVAPANASQIIDLRILNLPTVYKTKYSYEKGVEDARKDIADGKLLVKRYGLTPAATPEVLEKLKKKYSIEIVEYGCLIPSGFAEYAKGYNEISALEIRRKFGDKVLETTNLK